MGANPQRLCGLGEEDLTSSSVAQSRANANIQAVHARITENVKKACGGQKTIDTALWVMMKARDAVVEELEKREEARACAQAGFLSLPVAAASPMTGQEFLDLPPSSVQPQSAIGAASGNANPADFPVVWAPPIPQPSIVRAIPIAGSQRQSTLGVGSAKCRRVRGRESASCSQGKVLARSGHLQHSETRAQKCGPREHRVSHASLEGPRDKLGSGNSNMRASPVHFR